MPAPVAPDPHPQTRRQQRRRRVRGRTVHVDVFNYYLDYLLPPPPVPDWTELPLDVTLRILRCLDPVELLGRAARVCRFWRRATRDEPELWRRIDTRACSRDLPLDAFAREAVHRSAGRCEAFSGEYFGDDDFLLFLAEQAPALRTLCLDFFYKVTNEGFTKAIAKFPLLEDLVLTNCHRVDDPGVFEVVAKACPRLKYFVHTKYRHRYDHYSIDDPNNDREAMAIASMRELHSLKLFRNTLTDKGLAAIIDSCPHLESLDIRSCGNITMDDALQAKCARIKMKTLRMHRSKSTVPDLEDFEPGSSISVCSTCMMSEYFRKLREEREKNCIADSDDYYDPYDYYLSVLDEAHLEEHGRVLGKSMRRYNL